MTCSTCRGLLWVCVDHPTTPWGDEPFCCQCGTEGMACVCNPTLEMPPGTTVIAEAGRAPRAEH